MGLLCFRDELSQIKENSSKTVPVQVSSKETSEESMTMLHSVESAEETCYLKKLTNSNFEAEPSQGVKPATEQQPFKQEDLH